LDEITGKLRNLHIELFHNLSSSTDIVMVIKAETTTIFSLENLIKRDRMGELQLNGI